MNETTYNEEDLEFVIDFRMQEAINAHHPPRSVAAWRTAARAQELENERATPGFITRVASSLRTRADGQKITGWREVHGTHSIDWVYDPEGCASPPAGYSIPRAKADYTHRTGRKPPRPVIPVHKEPT